MAYACFLVFLALVCVFFSTLLYKQQVKQRKVEEERLRSYREELISCLRSIDYSLTNLKR